jgi:hypothetical protein
MTMFRLYCLLTTVYGLLACQVPSRPVENGKVSPDQSEAITCDLPEAEKFRNQGGRDGAGLCVFASITWAAKYQNERKLFQLFEQMRQEPGGGYPEKVDRMIAKYAPGAGYVQYEGNDPAILRAALAGGRMPSVTYNGHDPHYRGSIAHMVNLVHLSDRWACISDNNFPKDDQHVWLTPDAFFERWRGGRSGWAVVLLAPPPPPPPFN